MPTPKRSTVAVHDRSIASTNEGAAVDSETDGNWDQHDDMLFFWGNSEVATERHAQEEQERTENLEDWRAIVSDSFSN